jgi:hypothetical protein
MDFDMVSRIISKKIDIYSYPNQFEDNLGSITLGDLHGNTIKLIHFLFRHQIIKFKNEVINAADTYQQFVTVYELYGELLQKYLEHQAELKFAEIKITNIQDRLVRINNQIASTLIDDIQKNQELLQLRQQTSNNLHLAEQNKKSIEQQLLPFKEQFRDCIEQFNQLMTKLDINDNKTLIRLIGDEVGDRGNCDYFTLRVFDFLKQNNSQFRDLVSNHGCEFIYAYEQLMNDLPFNSLGTISEHQTTSFLGLKLLIDEQILSKNELCQLIERSYKPNLKIIDYSLSEQGITLFSHAPIQFDSIQLMARRLGVPYDDATKETLADTIDQINLKIQTYSNSNTMHSLFQNSGIIDKTNMTEEEKAAWPLIYFIWNRWWETKETNLARPAFKNGYSITYVHGHDLFQSKLPHIHNLDTFCGKESRSIENERINKAFQFIKENYYKSIDTQTTGDYLRSVLNYKVFDTDEQSSKLVQGNKIIPEKIPLAETDSMLKLSLLGGPVTRNPTSLPPPLNSEIISPTRTLERLIAEQIEYELSAHLKSQNYPTQ